MEEQKTDWKRMQFKANTVWVATSPDGDLREENGKVLLKYQLDQEHEYWVYRSSVRPLGAKKTQKGAGRTTPAGRTSPKTKGQTGRQKTRVENEAPPPDAICIYTDGASSGNPGPSGIGVLLRFGGQEKEISKHIGVATNNIAELEAIRTGLKALKEARHPVRVYTDSTYALGVLTLGWKTTKNVDLIQSIKAIMSTFSDLKVIKVKGHAGMEENERADRLATRAASRSSRGPG
jgi:ribonuclease HI